MRRSLFTALLILLAATVIAHGAPLDEAKQSNASAEKKITAVGNELAEIGRAISKLLPVLEEVAQKLEQQRERQKQIGPLIARALEAANADLAAAKAEATAAQRIAQDAEAALTRAQADVGPRRAAIERAAATERKAFEASDEYKQAAAKVDASELALTRERTRLDAALRSDSTIAPLAAAVEKAEADLKSARAKSPPDDAAVAELSGKWIDAKNALAKVRAVRDVEDEAFLAAQKAATAAAAARTALSDAFDRSILTQPGVAEAQLAYRDARNSVKLAEAALQSARDHAARAGRWLSSRRASADSLTQIARDGDVGLAEAAADLRRAQEAAKQIGREIAEAATRVMSIREDIKETAAAITAAAKKP